eukprot:316768_1
MELSNNNSIDKPNINYKVTINKLDTIKNNNNNFNKNRNRSKSLKSPSKTRTISRKNNYLSKSLPSPSKTTEHINFDSVYLSLGQYKSDSLPASHLSISAMNINKDATPTPAVSPNDNINNNNNNISKNKTILSPNNMQKTIIRNYSNDITVTPDQNDIED